MSDATDIINVEESGEFIRISSVAYDEIQPKFDEVVYISKTINTGSTTGVVLIQIDEPSPLENGIMWLHPITRILKIYVEGDWEEIPLKSELESTTGSIDINAGYF